MNTQQIETTDNHNIRYDSPMITFLRNQGINFSLSGHQHYMLKSEGWMDLVVETWYEGKILKVSVCHYGRQNCDAMRDPEIVYRVYENGMVVPEMYQNDYIGTYQEAVFIRDGKTMIRPALVKDLKSFTRTWTQNLKAQGHKLVKGD